MLYQIMKEIRNFFPAGQSVKSRYVILGGTVNLPFMLDGQYFLIEGSVFNDGVYQYPPVDLHDENFTGYITPLSPPREFLDLVENIKEWKSKYESVDVLSPYQSESFGGYTYQRASNSNGESIGWKDAFKSNLNAWRKH